MSANNLKRNLKEPSSLTVGRCRWKAFCIRHSLNVAWSELIREFWLVDVFSVSGHCGSLGPRSGFDLTKPDRQSSQWPLAISLPLNVTRSTRTMTKCRPLNSCRIGLCTPYVPIDWRSVLDYFPWCPRTWRYVGQVERLINVSPRASRFVHWPCLSRQRQYLREPRRLLMTIRWVHRSLSQIRLVVYKPRCGCNPLVKLIN